MKAAMNSAATWGTIAFLAPPQTSIEPRDSPSSKARSSDSAHCQGRSHGTCWTPHPIPPVSRLRDPSPFFHTPRLELATHQSLCRMCGAPTPAAHRSAPALEYSIASRSANTPASQFLPALLATCSPKTVGGWHWRMSSAKTGQRCRSSSVPSPFPATENGWHGHEPDHTGRSEGHPASCKA